MMSQQAQYLNARLGHGCYQNPGQQPNFSWQPGASQKPSPYPPVHIQKPKLSFMINFHFLDLSILINDPICHDPHWPPMLMKFPSDIPKFKGNPNEYSGDHVTNFHLLCSSNSLWDDSIHLCLFQLTLIELDHSRYSTFGKLAMVFLNHFQLPVRYDAGIKLWPTLSKQNLIISWITSESGGAIRVW